ncbi:hypothetical protein C8R45DRAFT_922268 [Mycena sanguinolenta]|nr:hypothetical protein C8R45DRAFT_922268 [Mycena sanguinolenta]
MDPITATTTIITLATFIKDLIEVGQSIQRSIEMVSENRRRIRDLTNDILRALVEIANLTRGKEDAFQAPALLSALGNLKEISPAERPGFRGFRSQIKAWMKREDIEAEIRHLREHVNKCYMQFTRLIGNHVENRAMLQRVQGMIAQVLIETPFGHNVMSQAMEVITSDPSHRRLESRYLAVETMHLIESLQQLVVAGNLVLDLPQWDPATPFSLVFFRPRPTRHILHSILGLVLEISQTSTLPVGLLLTLELGQNLRSLNMYSEAVAWNGLVTQILRQATINYNMNSPLTPAGNRWNFGVISATFPDVDNSQGLLASSLSHARHLLETGQPVAAISAAEEATALATVMLERLAVSDTLWTEPDVHKAVISRGTYFLLAKALSAAGRPMEAYNVSKQGLEIALRLEIPYPPTNTNVDSFLDQVCRVAEGGGFSPGMLEDCVVLFRDLSWTYFTSLSHQFLWLFYAYIYLAPRSDLGALVPNLRVFLEPDSRSPPPVLDISSDFTAYIEKFNQSGGIIRQTIYMFYLRPWPTNTRIPLLIKNLFITHFDEATLVLRELVVDSYSVEDQHYTHVLIWVLDDITDLLPLLPKPHQLELLGIMSDITGHLRENARSISSSRNDRNLFNDALSWSFSGFWMAGLLDEALSAAEESIDNLQSVLADGIDDEEKLHWFRLRRNFVLADMGRTSQAIESIQQTNPMIPDLSGIEIASENDFWLHCMLRARILRRVGRNREAQQMLKNLVSEGWRKYWLGKGQVLRFNFILAEYAAEEGRDAGEALRDAERAVLACRNEGRVKIEDQEHALGHLLPILSNCLAAVGKNDEALAVANEAASIYARNTSDLQVWKYVLYTVRRQELGAVIFHTLSVRLQTLGEVEDSLANARKSVDLYRELVSIAPRHLPALAKSLQNLASILWNIGADGRAESLIFCDEAVGIIRQVAEKEAHFLPLLGGGLSQLARYLADQDRPTEASAALAECAEVQKKIALLPSQTEFIFSVMDLDAGPQMPSDDTDFDTLIEVEGIPNDGILAIEAVGVGLPTTTVPRAMTVVLSAEDQELSNAKNSTKIEENWSIEPGSIEIRFKLSASQMDILWWMFVGILGILVGILSTVAWNRESSL